MPTVSRIGIPAAILTAALVSTVHADIVYQHSNAYVRADDEIGDIAEEYFGGGGPFSIEAIDGLQEARVVAGALSLELDTYSGATGEAFAVDVVSYFFVDAASQMTLSWDFDANTRYEAGRVILTNDDSGAVLVDVDFNSASPGAIDVLLQPGDRYRISANVASTDGAGASYARLAIPSPGSVALLGAGAVLFGARRGGARA